MLLVLSACGTQRSAVAPGTNTPIPTQVLATASPSPTPPIKIAATLLAEITEPVVEEIVEPSNTAPVVEALSPSATLTSPSTGTAAVAALPSITTMPARQVPSPTTASAYPGPFEGAYPGPEEGTYPGPEEGTYPGPGSQEENYPGPSGGIFGAGSQSNPTVSATPARATSTAGPSPTPTARATSTPLPAGDRGVFSPQLLPQTGSSPGLTIWHSLENGELAALEDVIRAFQVSFPQVSFDLTYIPIDELRNSYTVAVYQKTGPDLLLGPSEWAAELYDQGSVADLSGYFPERFWQSVIPVALETGQHRQAQVSLPVTMSGVVLYRNVKIIPQASDEFEKMVAAAQQATRGGIVGAYFELDPLYSMAHLEGLGGQWQDESGRPVFNRQNYAAALDWLELLRDFDRLGAVEMNTSRDLTLFSQQKVGLMIAGTWNLESITLDVGRGNFAIDSWPKYGSHQLSGYVFSQGFYLNSQTAAKADARLMAALQFMGSTLLPQTQKQLVEDNTFLPVIQDLILSDLLKIQAVRALEGGTAFSTVWGKQTFEVYRSAMQSAIRQAMGLGTSEQKAGFSALQEAYQIISNRLASQRSRP